MTCAISPQPTMPTRNRAWAKLRATILHHRWPVQTP